MRILSLCDYTGNMLKPWQKAGHECVAVDIAYEWEQTTSFGLSFGPVDWELLHGQDEKNDVKGKDNK